MLSKALDCDRVLKFVTPSKIFETWSSCCPVFGRLHSLIDQYKVREDDEDLTNIALVHVLIRFSFPSGKQLTLLYSSSQPGPSQETVRAITEPLDVTYNDIPNDDELIKRGCFLFGIKYDAGIAQFEEISCLDPVCKLLKEEIGEIGPLVFDGEMLKWFAATMPDLVCRGLVFKRVQLNEFNENSIKSEFLKKRQRIMNEFGKKIKINSKVEESLSPQKESFSQNLESNCGKQDAKCESAGIKEKATDDVSGGVKEVEINGREKLHKVAQQAILELADLLFILTVREASDLIKALDTAFHIFKSIEYSIYVAALGGKNVVTITNHLFQMLLLRVKFDTVSGDWGPLSSYDGEIRCKFEFKLCDSHMLFIKAHAFTSGRASRSPSFGGQSLEFHIPTLDIYAAYRFGEGTAEKPSGNSSCLSPVTKEIQRCIDNDCSKMQNHMVFDRNIKITNDFVAGFFTSLSPIDYAFNFQNRGIADTNYCMR